MEISMYFAVFSLVVFSQTDWISACVCKSQDNHHLQNYVCDNDFVLKGNVAGLEKAEVGSNGIKMRIYKVKVRQYFKAPNKEDMEVIIRIPHSKVNCGKPLVISRTYLFAGKIIQDQYHLDTCTSYITYWDKVTREQSNLLKKGTYVRNCQCQIKDSCKSKAECRSSCVMNQNWSQGYRACYEEKAYCRFHNKWCEWKGPKQFYRCESNKQEE